MNIRKNILIIGAGDAGKLLVSDILNNNNDCRIIGFVDDSEKLNNTIPILGKISDLPEVTNLYHIDEIIIAIPSAQGSLIRKILLLNKGNRIPTKIVPRNQGIIRRDQVKYSDVVNLDFEDYIGRRVHKKNVTYLSSFYKDKIVLITGGAGSIGSEIIRQLLDLDVKSVIAYDNSEYLSFILDQHLKENHVISDKYKIIIGSILNIDKLSNTISKYKPDIIFHAAAYKHVYLMEENPDEAILNNIIGTKNIVDLSIQHKVPNFIFISTDKAVNPTNIMGASKKLMEFYIERIVNTNTKFNIVRFGNVINSNGSVLPTFQRQIDDLGYLTVTHPKIKRFFMSIREAARLVIYSVCNSKNGEIFVLDMGELISINEIAECLIRSKGLIPGEDIQIKYIGLKKGEKLIEELYTDIEKENLIKLKEESIYRLKNNERCKFDIQETIRHLHNMTNKADNEQEIILFLKKLFPTLKLD